MKINLLIFTALLATFACSCGSNSATNNAAPAKPTPLPSIAAPAFPSPNPSRSVPQNADYSGKGVVTKINPDLGSIELNHEEIKDMMPAMQMEFNVSDKKLLNDLKVGDKVDFVLRYKDPTETIVAIKKIQ